ncbi:MAG: hypothetical protein QY314_03880 [Candidatus Dojkabacteria bacterium]|nr:MAG: hypothetical protein QY314_03880 [Candidatus Dojkabacteria bacterium]
MMSSQEPIEQFNEWIEQIHDPESTADPIIPALPTVDMGTIKVQLFDSLSYDETTNILVGQVLGAAAETKPTSQLEGFLEEAAQRDTNGLVLIYPDGNISFLFESDLTDSPSPEKI